MRIIINIDPIREGTKRLRIRTRYNLTNRDGKLAPAARNAVIDFYKTQVVPTFAEATDKEITDFVDEGEKA